MYIYERLRARAASGQPVRVGLVGAGKFGTMFLAQAPTTPGLRVSAIADLDVDRAAAVNGADRGAASKMAGDDAQLVRRTAEDLRDALANEAMRRAVKTVSTHAVLLFPFARHSVRRSMRRHGPVKARFQNRYERQFRTQLSEGSNAGEIDAVVQRRRRTKLLERAR